MSKINEIKAIYESNALVIRQCAALLNNMPDIITEGAIAEITGGNEGLEEYAFSFFLSSLFFEDDGEASKFHKEYYLKSVKKLNPNEYLENPYYKNIKIPQKSEGSWTLGVQTYKPYEAFIYNDLLVDGYREIPRIGFFNKEFSYPTVFENGVEWMAIKPNEIETMKKPIEDAFGNVAVFGLGLGYYAYMISEKESVSSITIIERDKNVISLFKKYILPQFENKHKIKIVEADAFDFLEKSMEKEAFDFAFVDLWHDTSDGVELYIKARKLEGRDQKTKFSYWIERSILSSIRASLFNAICAQIEDGKLTKTDEEMERILTDGYIKELVLHM